MNILIAEDDELLQRAYRRMIVGHELTIVDSAPAAILELTRRAGDYYGAIISDYDLTGGTTGRQIWLWAHHNRPALPFILVTGRYDTDLPVPTFHKPITREELEKALP